MAINRNLGCVVKVFLGVLTLLSVAFFVWIVYYFVLAPKTIDGKLFSPDDFTIRSFRYKKSIFGGQPFDKWTSDEGLIAADLLSNKWIRSTPPQTWHLVSDTVTSIWSRDRQADLLVDYLEKDAGKYWALWNAKHPSQAAQLWPIAQAISYDQLYILAPSIMDKALELQSSKPAFLEKCLRELIFEELLRIQKANIATGNTKNADHFGELAKKYDPKAGPLQLPPTQSSTNPETEKSNLVQ